MKIAKLYLIVGIFFEAEEKIGVAIDPQIGSRATIAKHILPTMFYGVLDKSIKEGVSGILHDRNDKSEIQTIGFEKVKTESGWKRRWRFSKTYTGNFNHTVYYKVFAESEEEHPAFLEWNGSWKLSEESGVVTFKTIAIEDDYFDLSRVNVLVELFTNSENKLFENI